jgi:hypothetical protein
MVAIVIKLNALPEMVWIALDVKNARCEKCLRIHARKESEGLE